MYTASLVRSLKADHLVLCTPLRIITFVNQLLVAFIAQARFVLHPDEHKGSARVAADCVEIELLGSQLFAAAGKSGLLHECAAWADFTKLRSDFQLPR